MLANDLAKTVADLWTAIVPVSRLRRELARLAVRMCRLGKGTNLLDRADADAVGLAQGPVDRPGLRYPHFGAVDQGRDIRGIGVAVAHETSAIAGFKDCGSECPSFCSRIGEFPKALHIYSRTFLSLSNSQETRMAYIPAFIQVKHVAQDQGQAILSAQLSQSDKRRPGQSPPSLRCEPCVSIRSRCWLCHTNVSITCVGVYAFPLCVHAYAMSRLFLNHCIF